jgi:mRNA-degrading endonuclease toxin of MazEF toxin-antitoxin module
MPTSINKWDVILIDFPYSNGIKTKHRPAAIFAIVINDLGGEDVIVAAITSQSGMRGIEVNQNNPEFALSGLKSDSRILPGKLFTCAKSEITSVIGKIGPNLQQAIKTRLREILSL